MTLASNPEVERLPTGPVPENAGPPGSAQPAATQAPPPRQPVAQVAVNAALPSLGVERQGAPQTAATPPAAINPQSAEAAQSPMTAQLVSTISKAISLGLDAAPNTPSGWAALADKYSTPTGIQGVKDAQFGTAAEGDLAQRAQAWAAGVEKNAAAGGGGSSSGGLSAFLAAVRQHESGGDYTAYNSGGGAAGAKHDNTSTWSSYARAAGYGQYANGPASAAPAAVQDAVAGYNATQLYNQYGSWKNVAEAWYYPAAAGNAAMQNMIPDPGAGNTETIGAYGDQIVSMMGGQGSAPASPAPQQQMAAQNAGLSPAASGASGQGNQLVALAKSQLGLPYEWGAESPGQAFDCSGLVQWIYAQAGISIPRTTFAMWAQQAHLPPGAQLQPGDLVFFGGSDGTKSNPGHVGMYIGNNQMIDAPYTGQDVRVESIGWGDYVGATRPGDANGSTTLAAQTQAPTAQAASSSTQMSAAQSLGAIAEQVSQGLASLASTFPGAGNGYPGAAALYPASTQQTGGVL